MKYVPCYKKHLPCFSMGILYHKSTPFTMYNLYIVLSVYLVNMYIDYTPNKEYNYNRK